MAEVLPRLAESDALIFGTPVYWYGPTALMKAFLDRFVYFNCPQNRPQMRGKGAVLANGGARKGTQALILALEALNGEK